MHASLLPLLFIFSRPITAFFSDSNGLHLNFSATRDTPTGSTATVCLSGSMIKPNSWLGLGFLSQETNTQRPGMLGSDLYMVTTTLKVVQGVGIRRPGSGLGFDAKETGLNLVVEKSSYRNGILHACFERKLDELGVEGNALMKGAKKKLATYIWGVGPLVAKGRPGIHKRKGIVRDVLLF